MIKIINYEEACNELMKSLNSIGIGIQRKKEEINRLRLETGTYKEIPKQVQVKEKEQIVLEESDNEFEEEVSFYLYAYKNLSDDFELEELHAILPRRNNKNYINLLLRLQLESVKEIKEINEIILDSELSKEELIEYNRLIETEKRKINYIKELITKKDEVEDNTVNNEIILVPTISGNIRLIDEIEHMPSEYYSSFLELINTIIDGSFKNVKTFTNDNILIGYSEVKGFKTRIAFRRIGTNTYALITAFIKKSDNDKLYRESLKSKIIDYSQMEERIKKCLNNPEFLEENKKQVQLLLDILSTKEQKKAYKKEDSNE